MALDKWTFTLIDITDKALRKTDEEARVAASLFVLISIQLGWFYEIQFRMDLHHINCS